MKKSISIILCIIMVLALTLPAAAVSSIAVKGIKLEKNSIKLNIGLTYALRTTLVPTNTTQIKLTYVTGNINIATIDATGKIMAVGKGTTTITVYTLNKSVFTKCTVIVLPTKAVRKTLRLATYDAPSEDGMTEITRAYMLKNPNIAVKIEVAGWTEYWTKLEAAAAGGAMPEVFVMHAARYDQFAKAGLLMDLKDLTTLDPTFSWANFDKSTVDGFTTAGKHLAFPISKLDNVLYYNKEIFTAAGIAFPDATWDWNKLLDVAKKLTNPAKGIYGFAARSHTTEGYESFIYENGGYVLSPDKKKSGFDLPETITAIQWWKDMSNTYKVSPTISQFAETTIYQMFMSGKLAMAPLYSSQLLQLTANTDIKDKFDVAELPKGKVKATIVACDGFVAPAKNNNSEETLKLLSFLASKEAMKMYGEKGIFIPAYNGLEDTYLKKYSKYNTAAIKSSFSFGVTNPVSRSKSAWSATEADIMTKILNNTIPVEEGCKTIATEMNKQLAND